MLLRSALDIYTCPFGADDGTCPFSTSIKADPVVMVDFSSRLLLPGRGTVTHSTSSQTCCCHSKVQTECCPFHLAFVYTFRSGISLTPLFFCFFFFVVVVKKVKGAPNTKRLWCVSCQFQDDGRRYWAQFKWMPDSSSEIRRRIHQLDSGRSVTASAELRSALAQQ
jgi:hypothetical protein